MKRHLEFKTVDWLVRNTKPQRKYFESFIEFITTNYRDTPSKEKTEEVVKAIEKEKFSFAFSYILNAENFSAVDGLARIYAFCEIKNRNPEIYEKIREKEVPVIFLDELDFSEEAKEYENINQGNKNKDLVPAKLVQKFSSRNKSSKDKEVGLRLTKIEFLCYELAKVLNSEHNYWRYKINFGDTKINESDFETISCTDFINSTKNLVSKLEKLKIIDIKLETGYGIEKAVETLKNIFFEIWNMMVCNFENAFIKEKGQIGRFINSDSKFARNLAANILIMGTEK